MAEKRDNYLLQLQQAQKLFLTYDQEKLIEKCALQADSQYLYAKMLSETYRICRKSGCTERFCDGTWVDGNGFAEVMTLLDWLCDSRADRYITGRWINVVTHGHSFHSSLQMMFSW